ncbi:Inhibitor of apoptosis protein [Willisornis vidua]|uniref:Inhibitor of apoptosis protein n=1 Tax=Willisornis vidua TaxID=1566151 RepID=A0ABQ9D081_9PASS|nr:Inhibitor of apoptosis protein [Willisornis vidua]
MNIVDDSPFLASIMRQNAACGELKYDLSCELYRMSTFSTFPVNAPISERSLARAGFYYTGVQDKVMCFSCGLTLDNWQPGDNAMEKHKQLYPSCSFVQSMLSVENFGLSSHSAFLPSVANSLSSSLRSISLSPRVEQVGYFSGSFSSFPQDPVTTRAVEDLSFLGCKLYNPSMSTQEARLRTFHSWPLTFLSPTDLAKAGLYYLGTADRVACFTCGGHLCNWEPQDNAVSEHRRHYPNCSFVENLTRDQPSYNVSNLSMQTHEARVKTFISWPTRIPVQPEQLADAGFYYVGRNDDVKCFCCDGGLRCWESGDDPWIEHAKWFPRCEYLLRVKGREFVSQIQARFPHLLEQLLSTSDPPADENNDPPIIHFGPGESRSEDAVMMNTLVIKAALEMGFSRRLIKQTVQSKILATGENYKTVNDLVSDLLIAEDEKIEEEKEKQLEEVASDDLSLIRKNRMALFQRLTCILPILGSLLSAKVITELEHDVIKQKTQTALQARELIDTILVKGNEAASIFRNCLRDCDPELYKDLFVEKNMKYVPTDVSVENVITVVTDAPAQPPH